MANLTVLKHKRDENFKVDFLAWVREQDLNEFNVKFEDKPELFQILVRFADELDVTRAIGESTDFITNEGLHAVASKLLEEFIKKDTHYTIIDNLEIYEEDKVLIVITD